MALFKTRESVLGIDFDEKSIKIVELSQNSGRAELLTYGYIDYQLELKEKELKAEKISCLIKAVLKKSKAVSRKCSCSLPAFSVFSSIITIPKFDKKMVPDAIIQEAKKLISRSVEEMVLDWKLIKNEKNFFEIKKSSQDTNGNGNENVLNIEQSPEENQKILLTAVPKEMIKIRKGIISAAGLRLINFQNESHALINSLIGQDKAMTMIVDISADITSITIVFCGIPIFSRVMKFGGFNITKTISQKLKISLYRAEQLKYDVGVQSAFGADNTLPLVIKDLLNPLLEEINYTLGQFNKTEEKKVEKIILTGGSSLVINLPQYLSESLNIKVYLGNPWARVVFPEGVGEILEEIGPRFSTAVGLAMSILKISSGFDLNMNYLKSLT